MHKCGFMYAIASRSFWLSITFAVEMAFLMPSDEAPTRLHGMQGSKNALQSSESIASCVELRKMHLLIDWKSSLRILSCLGGGSVEVTGIIGGANFGGGMSRDVKIKTEARPMRNSA